MHTDTFSFEVENEGEVYKVDAEKYDNSGRQDYELKICFPEQIRGIVTDGILETYMYFCRVCKAWHFSTPVSIGRFGVLSLEQKISDKIISRNE